MASAPVPLKPPAAREFTKRAVFSGLFVAAIIGASYPYIVLKLGFGPNISVVSAIFGYIILTGLRCQNRWQTNMVQTAGTAAGQTAFMCVIMAAFDILSREPGLGLSLTLTRLQTFAWLSTAGILGVLLAVPMRRHFIVDEKLTFADGVAAAETLIVLDSKGPQAGKSAFSMMAGMVVSGLTMLGQYFKVMAENVPVLLNRFSGVTGVGLSLSWLNLGSGMIIGLRITASMTIGTVAAWIVAPPLLSQYGVIPATAHKNDILLWVMWPATAMLVTGGLTGLVLRWRVLLKTFRQLQGAQVDSGEFPLRWLGIGIGLSGLGLVLVQAISLHTPLWETILAILFTLPLMLVGLRVVGETNWGPVSALSNLMQGVFGMLAPGSVRANMVASGVTGSVASESEGIMQVYKTGDMIGSTPRHLTTMNLLAIPVGAAAVAFMYPLLRDTYGIGGDNGLQSPISQKWVGFAKLLSLGFSHLPPSAIVALAVGSGLGILLSVLEQSKERRRWVPSPTGLGMGMLIPAGVVTGMLAGAVVEHIWRRIHPGSAEKYVIPVASGLIAGEALVAVVLPVLLTLHVLKPQ